MKKTNWLVLLPARTDIPLYVSGLEEERVLLPLFGKNRRPLISTYLNIKKKNREDFWKLYDEFQLRKRYLAEGSIPRAGTEGSEPKASHDAALSHELKEKNLTVEFAKLYRRFQKKFTAVIGRTQSQRILLIDLQLDCYLFLPPASNSEGVVV